MKVYALKNWTTSRDKDVVQHVYDDIKHLSPLQKPVMVTCRYFCFNHLFLGIGNPIYMAIDFVSLLKNETRYEVGISQTQKLKHVLESLLCFQLDCPVGNILA